MDIFIDGISGINHSKLHEELTALSNSSYQSLGTRAQQVVLHVTHDASEEDVSELQVAIQAHDPNLLTAKQQAKIDRLANLDSSRGEHPNEIDSSLYDGESALILQLAERIQLLEREVRVLRNGSI